MNEISKQEQIRRSKLAHAARTMVLNTLPIEDVDESGLMMDYQDFYLQIDFSQFHPLMMFSFHRKLEVPVKPGLMQQANDLNQKSVLGCHVINPDAGFYAYRAAHWLDSDISKPRFLEMLGRCYDEATRAFSQLNRPL